MLAVTMFGMKIRALLSAAMFFCSVGTLVSAEPTAEELREQAQQAEMYMNAMGAVADLAELNSLLIGLTTPEDVQAAMPHIAAAVDAYHRHVMALPEECNPARTPEWEACFEEWSAQNATLKSISEDEDFQALLAGHEGLMYELLLKSENLLVFVGDSQVEYMIMGATDPTLERPAVVRERAATVRAEARMRHHAFMQQHADIVSGGDGANAAAAIVFKSASQKDRSVELNDEQMNFIEQYIGAVYPQSHRGFTFRQFSPDGTGYIIFMLYEGVCADASGKQYIINVPVYFLTRAAKL